PGPDFGARLIVSRNRRRNDAQSGRERRPGAPVKAPAGDVPHRVATPGQARLGPEAVWGWHAALAALENPRRGRPRQVLATAERARQLIAKHKSLDGRIAVLETAEITRRLPA